MCGFSNSDGNGLIYRVPGSTLSCVAWICLPKGASNAIVVNVNAAGLRLLVPDRRKDEIVPGSLQQVRLQIDGADGHQVVVRCKVLRAVPRDEATLVVLRIVDRPRLAEQIAGEQWSIFDRRSEERMGNAGRDGDELISLVHLAGVEAQAHSNVANLSSSGIAVHASLHEESRFTVGARADVVLEWPKEDVTASVVARIVHRTESHGELVVGFSVLRGGTIRSPARSTNFAHAVATLRRHRAGSTPSS